MGEVTYNCGRVVGWSAYEDFLKAHHIGPDRFSKAAFVRMLEFGIASKVSIPLTGWTLVPGTTNVYRKIVNVEGANWGCTLVCGLDFEYYTGQHADELEAVREAVSNIFTFFVSDQNGVPAETAGDDAGHLTFLAYPELLDTDVESVSLLVKGLGIEAVLNESEYCGPMGILTFSSGSQNFWAMEYERHFGVGDPIEFSSQPIIDLKRANGEEFYEDEPSAMMVTVHVDKLKVTEDTASVFIAYQKSENYPPALYAFETDSNRIDSTEEYKAWPLDCVAPGTVKLVTGEDDNIIIPKAAGWERALKGVHSFYRKDSDLVLREIKNNDIHNLQAVPVAEATVENQGGMHWFNRKAFRFEADGVSPTESRLAAVNAVTFLSTLTGYVNQEFIDEFAVEISDLYDLTVSPPEPKRELIIGNKTLEGGVWVDHNNPVMFQILEQIPQEEWTNYYAILISTSDTAGSCYKAPNPYSYFIPVNKQSRLVEFTASFIQEMRSSLINGPVLLNFTKTSRDAGIAATGNDRWSLMGTWWAGIPVGDGRVDKSTVLDPEYPSVTPYVYIDDHPAYSTYQKDRGTYGREFAMHPMHATPNPPKSQYGTNWVTWFDTIKIGDFFTDTEKENSGILEEYWSMTLNKFCENACIRDLGLPVSDDNQSTIALPSWMLFKKEDILQSRNIEEREVSPTQIDYVWDDYLKASHELQAESRSNSFYAPAFIEFLPVTWISEDPPQFLPDTENPEKFDDEDNAVWAAKTQTGNKSAFSLSLSDPSGGYLPVDGGRSTISVDMLTWQKLLTALSNDQTLDLLGEKFRRLKTEEMQSLSLKFNSFAYDDTYVFPVTPFYLTLNVDVLGSKSRNTDYSLINSSINLVPNQEPGSPDIDPTDPDTSNWYQVFQLDSECIEELRNLARLLGIGNEEGISNSFDIMISNFPAQVLLSGRPSEYTLPSLIYISLNSSSYGRAIIYFRNNGYIQTADRFSTSGSFSPAYKEQDRYQESQNKAAGFWTPSQAPTPTPPPTGLVKIYECTGSSESASGYIPNYLTEITVYSLRELQDFLKTAAADAPNKRYYADVDLNSQDGSYNNWRDYFGTDPDSIAQGHRFVNSNLVILKMNESLTNVSKQAIGVLKELWKIIFPTTLSFMDGNTFDSVNERHIHYICFKGEGTEAIRMSRGDANWGAGSNVTVQWNYQE